MCDWDAEEYVEYLLWVEAEKASARVRPAPREGVATLTKPVEIPTAAAES